MRTNRWLMIAALSTVLLGSTTAWAGELVIGAAPLEVDASGNLTKDARTKAVTEIESSVPGDEVWKLHVWAKLDKAAVGPLYLEFQRDHDGEKLVAHRVEVPDFAGGKYVSMVVDVSRSEGFRAGETLDVAFVQQIGKKDVKKAAGKIKMLASSQPAPTPEPEPEEKDELDEPEATPEEPQTSTPEPEGPPPVDPDAKKGCAIGSTPSTLALLGIAVLGLRQRNRRKNLRKSSTNRSGTSSAAK